jgi:hypothetical protein
MPKSKQISSKTPLSQTVYNSSILAGKGAKMNKQDVKNLVDGMPDGMDVDDYLVELINRALFVERRAIIDAIEAWDADKGVSLLVAVINRRGT